MPLLETKGAASAQGFGEFAKSGPANYIEEVFSTYLYTGNSSTQTITNNIDLSTKGGLVWLKARSAAYANILYDTARGVQLALFANTTNANIDYTPNGLTAFNSNGFSLGPQGNHNLSGVNFVSWTFRKQPKFFDIVTYTGNGSNRTIAHNLGSVPGCIIIKRTDTTAAWAVYHRSLANTEYLVLNTTAAKATGATYWNSTTPTATEFSLGTATDVNANTGTYVAYLFAHDAGGFGLTGSDNVISCESYTGDGVAGKAITLGYEPQWVMIKDATGSTDWFVDDTMRGLNNSNNQPLEPNQTFAEGSASAFGTSARVIPTATGFVINTTGALNISGRTYIYIAIRRGPMKVPTSGTSVFSPVFGGATDPRFNTGFNVDLGILSQPSQSGTTRIDLVFDRLRGSNLQLNTNDTAAEVTSVWSPYAALDYNNGWATTFGSTWITWNFQRAPGYFDVVCYTGDGASSKNLNHNLAATPQLIIVKSRSSGTAWLVYSATLGAGNFIRLDTDFASQASTTAWNNTAPTSTQFTVGAAGSVNLSGATFVAYLFATCAGVSKVGSYTGTGALQTVNCGFTGGARFVLIKRTDSTGDWYVYDSARGISNGTDPYLLLNSTAAEVTTTNYVDTDTTGFKVTAAAPAGLNANGGTYIFLAIA